MAEPEQNVPTTLAGDDDSHPAPTLSKSARKKLLKQERFAARKAERKAAEKERKRQDLERRRREWDERLASAGSEEERAKLVESRRDARRERMEKRSEERGMKLERLRKAAEIGQKIVIDLEFAHLMNPNEIHSLSHQIMYCYSVNGRCATPAHLWLTGFNGQIENQLQKIPGFENWIIGKESNSYMKALEDQRENLVYLTADSESVLEELDPKNIYIIGGLVDRNRWKGITMKKANEQGIQSAKLPIGNYLKMSSSQVLTVNQVFEIMLKFIETRDWSTAFFQVIPLRKRGGEIEEEDGESESNESVDLVAINEDCEEKEEQDCTRKKQCTREPENGEYKNKDCDVSGGKATEGNNEDKLGIKDANSGAKVELL